jgi:hypothetical protein
MTLYSWVVRTITIGETRLKKFLVLALLTVGTSFASTIAMTTSGGSSAGLADGITFGWSFAVNGPISVTSLGYYDENQDGLDTDHEVGIFDSNGVLLISTTVSSGTGGTLSNGFKMASITPLSLAAGTYTIAGFSQNTTDRALFNATLTTAPEISFIEGYIYTFDPQFAFPQTTVSGISLTSVNFEFDAETPEPSTMLLSLGAFAALGLKKRFSKHA